MVMAETATEHPQAAVIRSRRERIIQTLAYELGGLLIASPVWSLVSGASGEESLLLLGCLSLAVMLWAAVYNTAYDIAEHRLTGWVASNRPHNWRILHAIGYEASAVVVTTPLLVTVAGFTLLQALAADLGLTVLYAAYGYVFHIIFDRLRPVCGDAAARQPERSRLSADA
jgi:uncharacterized membrane protein